MATIIRGQDFVILSGRPPLQIGAGPVELSGSVDGFLSETHELRVSKTTYPVESGQSLIDHAVMEPRTLELEGWVSDLLVPESRPFGQPRYGSSAEAWEEISELVRTRKPVSVITMLGLYENMLITSVKAPVDRTTGRALRFDMELEEVLFRDLERGVAPAPVRTGPAGDRPTESNRGKVHAPPVTPLAALEIIAAQQQYPRPMVSGGPSVAGRIFGFFRRLVGFD